MISEHNLTPEAKARREQRKRDAQDGHEFYQSLKATQTESKFLTG